MDRRGIDEDAGISSISDGRGVSPETTKLSDQLFIDDQHVAATRQCLQGRPTGVSQGAPNVADGLDEGILRDLAIRPDLIHNFVLADQLPGPCIPPSTRDMEETWFAPGNVRALAGEYEG